MGPDEALVWIADTADLPNGLYERLEKTLSEAERDHASRFRFDQHRSRYIVSQGLLREVLARYLELGPEQVTFRQNDFGKPSVAEAIEFNMSRSENLVVIAITRGRAIGIDTEFVRPIEEIDLIAQHYFTAAERALLDAAPAFEQDRVFYTCWTRKEAYVKAVGRGLSIPLTSFDVSMPLGSPGRLILGESKEWWLSDLTMPPTHVGSLVIEGGPADVRYFHWEAEA